MSFKSRLIFLLRPWFFILCLIYLINRFIIKESGFAFADHHLDDFLSVPIVLHLSSFVMSLIYKIPEYKITDSQVIITVIYISLLFELFLPWYSTKYHSDLTDVFCYIAGAIVYKLLPAK